MNLPAAVFAVHLWATGMMAGLIWLVQLETYPGFLRIEPDRFPSYHAFHCQRISWLVVPVMISELATAVVLWLLNPLFYPRSLQALGFLLLVLVWLSTFFIQVPCHNKLSHGVDRPVVKRLIRTNWIRTCGWSMRFVMLVVVSIHHL